LFPCYSDNLLRRAACQEAQVWGNQIIPSNMQIKKATVFLNPAACKGKARTLFEKNAAPILHLSGLDVTVVKTDYEGQAKKLLELMENTDMIIIAGGDGTVQEVITGLLRRPDEASFSKIPIGFIPLGKTSTLSHTLYTKNDNQVQCIIDATLSILRGETVQLDVLQIKGNKEQPVFAVNGLRWGSYRDAGAKVSKYWYLGPLKIQAAHFFNTLKDRMMKQQQQNPNKIKWCIEETPEAWNEIPLSALEFSVTTQNRNLDLKREEDFMNICIESDAISRGDYVKKGMSALLCCCVKNLLIFLCRQDTEGSLAIDNEEHEAMTVEVKLLPRKLHFFCDARRKVEMLQGIS
uniref:Acylglycerol kinase, mitochondrial n=1 Tax=Pseudonaja textilis TaxID=8673 RepID=A0A670YND9_PSETE